LLWVFASGLVLLRFALDFALSCFGSRCHPDRGHLLPDEGSLFDVRTKTIHQNKKAANLSIRRLKKNHANYARQSPKAAAEAAP
jgi:hypothetical protein